MKMIQISGLNSTKKITKYVVFRIFLCKLKVIGIHPRTSSATDFEDNLHSPYLCYLLAGVFLEFALIVVMICSFFSILTRLLLAFGVVLFGFVRLAIYFVEGLVVPFLLNLFPLIASKSA